MPSGTNPVSDYAQTNFTIDTGTAYKTKIDKNFIVGQRVVGCFAPRQAATPAMTVTLDAGHIFAGTTLTEVASQVTGTITAPTGNPRIDRVVVDRLTGVIAVITGTPGVSPAVPAITSGKSPICQVLIQVSSTTVTNAMITDERDFSGLGHGTAGEYNVGTAANNIPLLDGSARLPAVDGSQLTGVVVLTAPTAAAGTSTTQIATTAFVNSTALTLANNTTAVTQAAANNSTKVATTAYVDRGGTPNTYQATPSNPTGTTSASGVMMGLAGTLTPVTSTAISVTICGTTSNASAFGNAWQIRYGTGSAPANAAAPTGTAVGPLLTAAIISGSANQSYPFSVTAIITGLTVGTAYWLDLSLSSTGGVASMINVGVSALEIH